MIPSIILDQPLEVGVVGETRTLTVIPRKVFGDLDGTIQIEADIPGDGDRPGVACTIVHLVTLSDGRYVFAGLAPRPKETAPVSEAPPEIVENIPEPAPEKAERATVAEGDQLDLFGAGWR